MKKSIVFFFFCLLFQNIFSQEILLDRENIIGRWIEVKEINNKIENTEYPDTYIFRDNGTFHLGEASNGVILFNIAGKYTIEEDTIKIIYFDLIQNPSHNEKAKQMLLKATSINNDLIKILVTDYDYSYQLILKKQNISQ